MMKESKFVLLMFFLILLMEFISAQQINPNEYLDEFNNDGENCTISDSFFYTNSNNQLSFISIYNCCKGNSCVFLPFDVQNKKELSQIDLQESFDIDFARMAIRNKKLIPTNYFPNSVDVCSYFSDKLPEQSRNLAVKASDKVVKYAPKNYQKIYTIIKAGGTLTGFISEFEIGVFVVGVGCSGLSKHENEAFFKVAECYNNLQSIESGTTYYGICSETYNCMQEADILLKEVINSLGQKIKGSLNKAGNAISGLWDWGKDLSKGNLSARVDIKETTYEAAKRVDGKLNIEKTFLENPNGFTLSNNAQKRFSEKRALSIMVYYSLNEKYTNISNQIPSRFTEFLTSLFYEPNIDYNESRFYLNNAKNNLEETRYLIQISKYNSAMNLNSSIYGNLNQSLTSYQNESKTETEIDYLSTFLIIIIIGALIFFILKIIKEVKNEV